MGTRTELAQLNGGAIFDGSVKRYQAAIELITSAFISKLINYTEISTLMFSTRTAATPKMGVGYP